jgi:2-iminobutanoate/2-iminopropanoate deaminase
MPIPALHARLSHSDPTDGPPAHGWPRSGLLSKTARARAGALVVGGLAVLSGCVAPQGESASTPDGNAAPAAQVVESAEAPAAIGPYSQAIRAGHTVYLAGQLGIDPGSGDLVAGGIREETRQAMENLGAVLRAAGLGFEHVVLTQVYLQDVEEFGAMNEVYGEYFRDAPPARATVEVARLPRDGRVEIQMTAVGPAP